MLPEYMNGIKSAGDKLNAMAYSEDGLIEAVCHSEKEFVWGLQWHPEFNCHCDNTSGKIFKAFVEACIK